MLDALTDNPQDFVEVSGTALAAGVCIEKRWEIPAASALPLTEPGAVQVGSRSGCRSVSTNRGQLNVRALNCNGRMNSADDYDRPQSWVGSSDSERILNPASLRNRFLSGHNHAALTERKAIR